MSEGWPIITLTTDFGTGDFYVSALKSSILRICRAVHLTDISHDIPPYDIMAGAWVLQNAAFLYPEKTIHIVVVDPQVRTNRKIIAIERNGHFFISPDNGLLSLLLPDGQDTLFDAVQINNPVLWDSFSESEIAKHDIYGPAAAMLAKGAPLSELGQPLTEIKSYRWAKPVHDSNGIQGWVVHIDTFGNLISNIPSSLIDLYEYKSIKLYTGTSIIKQICSTYDDVPDGETTAITGSSGNIEICVNKGSAAELLGVQKGAPVTIVFQK
ncbi:MAG: SAM-dependent chlorinase/fluorinase [Balneolales bacterium]|nr:SAM-dependent chlorinase/fluorinase [Balneolales bacterium]